MCKKAAVFILLGQSNAVGHGIPMTENDRIVTPLKNVFGLHRKDNQFQHPTELIWNRYTSNGMNLGEEQDHTYSLANCLAKQWQEQIDNGTALPNLYIVHLAIGAQGVTKEYMWHPGRKDKLIPGVLGTADISLFPFSVQIFSLLTKCLSTIEDDFEIIGLHWRGGEEDVFQTSDYLKDHLESIYQTMWNSYNRLLDNPPIILHKIVCDPYMLSLDPDGKAVNNLHYINRVFDTLANKNQNVSLFDVRNAPFYDPNTFDRGIFIKDGVHYTHKTNHWVAEAIIKRYCEK